MPTPLHVVTSNAKKYRELVELLGVPLIQVDIELEEIQTTHLRTLLTHKLKQAYQQVAGAVLVEDTSLYFEACQELPGTLIKWFTQNLGLEGVVKALSPFENTQATAICGLGYTKDGQTTRFFEGRLQGHIVSPRGTNGFGWDQIFQPLGYAQTLAEMPTEEKHRISMRQQAVAQLKHYLVVA